MINNFNDMPVTTLLLGIAFIIVVIVGGVVCIVGNDFEFQEYATTVGILAGALGLLGIGRGINSGQKHVAAAESLANANQRAFSYEEPVEPYDAEPLPEDIATEGPPPEIEPRS